MLHDKLTMSYFIFVIFMHIFGLSSSQLIVNVKNKGGEVLRERIQANTTFDTITLDFQELDGTLVTQLFDFKNEVQIFHLVILGEEERGQTGYQELCFLTHFIKDDIITSDAMSKLRQKNPGATRNADEDKGSDRLEMDLRVDISLSHFISPHIATLCQDAADAIYTRDAHLKLISNGASSRDYMQMLGATKHFPVQQLSKCHSENDMYQQCGCSYDVCIGWYPCGLKYCRGKDSTGNVVSYRCGIKTCRRCHSFDYAVQHRRLCVWDEPDVPSPALLKLQQQMIL